MNSDSSFYLRLSLLVAAVGACVTDLELLTLYKDVRSGMLSFGSFENVRFGYKSRQPFLRIDMDRLDYPVTLLAIGIQLISSLLIGLSALQGEISLTGLGIFVACGLLLRVRGGLGNNGADEMIMLIMAAGLLARVFNTASCTSIVLVFLSAQLSLSYLTSGLVKVRVLHWRDGTSMVNLMGTETFGSSSLHTVLRSSPLSAAFVSSVLVFGELFGSFAPWLPRPYAVSLLCCSLSFHLAAAVVMGLNTFVPAFVATYPAALYTSQILYTPHGWHKAG
jgi:hypothetical protein